MLKTKTTSTQQERKKAVSKAATARNYKTLITILLYGHFWNAVLVKYETSIEQLRDVLQNCKENLNCVHFNSQREYEINIKMKRLLESKLSITEDDSAAYDHMNSPFTEQEVINATEDLKNKKACGLDGSPSEALKAATSSTFDCAIQLYSGHRWIPRVIRRRSWFTNLWKAWQKEPMQLQMYHSTTSVQSTLWSVV